MYTLGVNAAGGSASACLVQDGRIVAAMRAAAPSGTAACAYMPWDAIRYCLDRGGITPARVAHVVYAGAGPVQQNTAAAPSRASAPWLLHQNALDAPWETHVVPMQRAREAAACLPGPHPASAYLVMDADGVSCGMQEGHAFTRVGCGGRQRSAAALNNAVARHLGFPPDPQADALTALAPCGRPGFVPVLRELVQHHRGGDLAMAHDWRELLGPPRLADQELEQRHMDIAHSLQHVLEETMLGLADWLHGQTRSRCLSLGGPLARNHLLAGALRRRSAFEEVWVGPAIDDAGTAVGAALLLDAQRSAGADRAPQTGALPGPSYTDAEIERVLAHSALPYRRCPAIAQEAATLLARDQIIGWFQAGTGPGGRAVLAAPFHHVTQERLQEITGRTHLHTGAAMVPQECAAAWFVDAGSSPFQSFADHAKPEVAHRIAGACHVDGSVRLHTVAQEEQALLHQLLANFGSLTGVPVVINAACMDVLTPRDALTLFTSSGIDALAMGPFLLEKSALRGP